MLPNILPAAADVNCAGQREASEGATHIHAVSERIGIRQRLARMVAVTQLRCLQGLLAQILTPRIARKGLRRAIQGPTKKVAAL
jgi:hypothetical protein